MSAPFLNLKGLLQLRLARGFSDNRALYNLLSRGVDYDHDRILEAVSTYKPTDKLYIPSKFVYKYLDSNASQIPLETKIRLAQGLTHGVQDVDHFKRFCGLIVNFSEDELPRGLLFQFKTKFFKFLSKLDHSTTFDIMKKFSRMTQLFQADELRLIFQEQLQKMGRPEILREFVKLGHLTNPIFYSLVHSVEDIEQACGKEEAFRAIWQSGIVLPPKYRAYFADLIGQETSEQSQKLVDLNDYPLASERQLLYQDKGPIFFVKMLQNRILASGAHKLRQELEAELQKRLESLSKYQRELFPLLALILEGGDPKKIQLVTSAVAHYLSTFQQLLIDEPTTQRFFESVVFVLEDLVTTLETVPGLANIPQKHKEMLAGVSQQVALILEKLVLEEDMKVAFLNMEDMSFRESKLGKLKFRIRDFKLSPEAIDCTLRICESLSRSNFGDPKLLKAMTAFVSDLLAQSDLPQLARGLMYLFRSNFQLEEVELRIEDTLKAVLKDDPEAVYRTLPTADLEVAMIAFLTLTGKLTEQYLKPTAASLAQNARKMMSLTPEQNVILSLVKLIHHSATPPLFEGIHFKLPSDVTLFAPSAYADQFQFFFDHLFYKDVKTNRELGLVNAHYVQNELALLCADFDCLTGETDQLKGLHALAKMALEAHYNEVQVVKKSETEKLDKRNDEMHLLRLATKRWKVDFEAREVHYSKYKEGVKKEIFE